MGGDSAHGQVTPRRLSKPRMNNSSSNLLGEQPATPFSPQNSSDLDYFGSDAVVVDSRGQRRSRSKSRSRIKAYLYGSSHDLIQTSSDEDETQTGIAGAARDVRKRLSRTGSSIMSLQSTKVSILRLSNSSSSGLLSSRSTESQEIDSEESAMVADQIKQRAYHDSLAAQTHVSTPVDEDKHIDSTMAPVRRKSLYTPGIATRNASDILRKPPKPLTDREYYYDPSRPQISPLSHLASLSVGEDGRSTPCDIHYPQLGGLQLGTLRVTNGASSPAPVNQPSDSEYRPATPESKIHDQYYTASEGSVTGDHAISLSPRVGSPLKHESKTEGNMGAEDRVPSSPKKSSAFERETSNDSFPFSREIDELAARFEKPATDQRARVRSKTSSDVLDSEKRTLNDSLFNPKTSQTCAEPKKFMTLEKKPPNGIEHLERERPEESFHLEMWSFKRCRVDEGTLKVSLPIKDELPQEVVRFEKKALSELLPSKTRSSGYDSVQGAKPEECCHSGATSPNGALDIADEYIAELGASPFAYTSPKEKTIAMPTLRDCAKETWRPYTLEADVQHAGNGSGSKEDAFPKLTTKGNMPSTWKPERLCVPPSQASKCTASSEMPQTDSGYCSYADEVCFETEDNSISPTKTTTSLQSQTLAPVRSSARSSFRGPKGKLKKRRPKSQPPPVNLVPEHHNLTDANIPRIPSLIAARHANRLSRFPLLEHTFPSLQHTTADGTLSPIQVHDTPIRFPSPASTLQAVFAPLESFRIANPKPRASTTAVDEDDWGASDLVRSPSWSEFGGGRKRKEQRELAKEEKEIEKRSLKEKKVLEKKREKSRKELNRYIRKDETKQRFTNSRSASRTRARSSECQSRHDTLMTIADFGTVTESLGNSPYDIAKLTPPNLQNARSWYPHQISTAMPRPNPSLAARARAQTMFSDMPSVPALAAVDLKVHNLEWARQRQRNQISFAANAESLRNPGANAAKLGRSDNVTTKVTPPVPALPSATQVKRREAEIMRSRPRSMFVVAPVPIATSQEIEDGIAVTRPAESGFSATPRKKKGSEMVPDIWSSGSLERKNARTVDGPKQESNNVIGENDKANNDQRWETQNNAWSHRRKSAGEALLRSRVKDDFDSEEAASSTVLCEHTEEPIPGTGAFTRGVYQAFMPTLSHLDPFPNALTSHPQSTAQQPASASSTPGSHNQSTRHQTERYGFTPLASTSRPCVSSVPSIQHGNQPPTSTLCRAKTQSFQIQRKCVGSGRSMIRTETAIGSGRYESVLV